MIGAIARSVIGFRTKLAERARIEAERQTESQRRADEERHQLMMDVAEDFERSVISVVEALSSAAGKVGSNTDHLREGGGCFERGGDGRFPAPSAMPARRWMRLPSPRRGLSEAISGIGRDMNQAASIADEGGGRGAQDGRDRRPAGGKRSGDRRVVVELNQPDCRPDQPSGAQCPRSRRRAAGARPAGALPSSPTR